MKPHTQKAVHWASIGVFSIAFFMSVALLLYGFIVFSGGGGDEDVDLLWKILQKRESTSALFGAFLTALPAASLSMANTRSGRLTSRGKLYLCLLIPLWLVSALANILIEPYPTVVGTEEMATAADTFALSIFTYATTFLVAIFGLNQIATDD